MATRCKHYKTCGWSTDLEGEQGMKALRTHWARRHAEAYAEYKTKMFNYEQESRYCTNCGVSQLSGGYIFTCSGCKAWYCSGCGDAHRMCGKGGGNE